MQQHVTFVKKGSQKRFVNDINYQKVETIATSQVNIVVQDIVCVI